MELVEKEEFEKAIEKLKNKIEKVRIALLLLGECPDCGEKLESIQKQGFRIWECTCGLKIWLSLDHIRKDIKKGQVREKQKTISLYVHRCHKCGMPITPEPTALETFGEITIICENCASAFL